MNFPVRSEKVLPVGSMVAVKQALVRWDCCGGKKLSSFRNSGNGVLVLVD